MSDMRLSFAQTALLLVAASAASDEKLSLFNVIELSTKNHPEIQILEAKLAQAQARSAQSPRVPPPMVSFGATGANGPFDSQGRMENAILVSQDIPFPTKLAAEGRARNAEEAQARDELKARVRSIRAEVTADFFDLYQVRTKLTLLQEKREILVAHVERVRATPLSDRLAQAHLLRVQTDSVLAQNEIDDLAPQEIQARGRLNIALGREPGAPLPQLELPPLSDLPMAMGMATAKEDSTAKPDHPLLQSIRSSVEAADAETSLAHSAWLPDFKVQFRSNRRFDGVMPNNSELMIGVELPFLFFWQPQGQIAEAHAKLEEQRARLSKTEAELRLGSLQAEGQARSLRSQILRYEHEILPRAEKRMKIAHGISPTDMESLEEHRNAMEGLIDLKTKALDLRIRYERAIADGKSLTPQEEK